MALEKANWKGADKLKAKLKEKFPNYNFDLPAPHDTKCKSPLECKGMSGNITYYDNEGNVFCGRRYKQAKDDNPYDWSYRECHALLKENKQGGKQDEIPF